jgi:predicted phosphodiesterase
MHQLRNLHLKHNKAPIFIAGDLLNAWNCSPHLLSHIMLWFRELPVFAIPGNHDVPHHNYFDLPKSGYWTLVEAGTINHLTPGGTHTIGNVVIHPFPHGHSVTPCSWKDKSSLCFHVALIHDFFYTKSTGYPGAPEANRYSAWTKRIEGYDVAVWGDNHQPVLLKPEGKTICLNCGTFIRRHSDEKDVKPGVGMLWSDGTVTRHLLDTSKDMWLRVDEEITKVEKCLELDLAEFARDLSNMDTERMDYARTVLQWIKKSDTPDRVKEIILRVLKSRS